jgi:hypothetical protein
VQLPCLDHAVQPSIGAQPLEHLGKPLRETVSAFLNGGNWRLVAEFAGSVTGQQWSVW